ncbi:MULTISPECIES: biotin-dependent carboxyltransferase family protein [Rhizobium]|uniref:5-oxoprolinase subunit C family protein n=1 Tax=Rhizobium TaxID=379 RepID=UPI001B32B655|nr:MULTISPECIES: biotin-dependent carboxyltransferase family protein [Rhizobium]MBX4909462.1 biotin-dependent carboxyltransferase family protein [Rhizobium bangladeshense]MBX5223245.1 biotin-dependent carboxyltransferase family protein [Rhizobium sp. NLR8a]MBX5234712.1 biotin-dependent carboxyltransferase family protein [Rhizobium sp. NLR4a]MBX5240395.1 biotin-dependent carboxyltransferase family protein [Rhizobium sp. NLR22b]MBX5251965.1 biotin-dependent carboxyltransferase family protein [Rh
MIEILESGPFNTVQDLGRPGYRDIGVSASGAMDPLAVRIGNILVGNDENAAVVEVQTFPFRLRFERRIAFAITGADGNPHLDGSERLAWCAYVAEPGQVLELKQPPRLARSYVALGGGLDIPVVMGSRSTSLRGGFGGNAGRPLAKGDRIAIGEDAEIAMLPATGLAVVEPATALSDVFPAPVDGVLPIRALPAGEHELFTKDGEAFWSQTWRISSRSDRTGYRLSGEPIKPVASIEMRSHGVVPGVIQVPPGGEPIVQMSDANTAGGYPKIAGVIESDLWRLGQARIGARLSFVRSTHAEARAVEQAVARYVDDVRRTSRMVKRALKAMA